MKEDLCLSIDKTQETVVKGEKKKDILKNFRKRTKKIKNQVKH